MHVGIDVGADRLHCVAIAESGAVAEGRIFAPPQLADLVDWLKGASYIAIDAPAMLSPALHPEDEALSLKFRSGRCAEIALGLDHRIWVPWVTPTHDPPMWMRVGLDLFAALQAAGHDPIEVYPHAGFRVLAPEGKLPSKSTVAGLEARVRILEEARITSHAMLLWSHDSLDAAMGALIALRHARGQALRVGCGHDDSAIWLPWRSLTTRPGIRA